MEKPTQTFSAHAKQLKATEKFKVVRVDGIGGQFSQILC